MKKAKQIFPESVHFIKRLEFFSGLEPSQIYTKLNMTRQLYSLYKIGQMPLTNKMMKAFSSKVGLVGIDRETYKTVCNESLSYMLGSK